MNGNIHTLHLIDGQDCRGDGDVLTIINPATEDRITEFAGVSTAQVDQAVRAARAAFDSGVWADAGQRRRVMTRFADLLIENRDALMDLLIAEVGTPVNLKSNHVDTPANFIRWFAEQATRDRTVNLGFNVTRTATSHITYRPVGVVAAISAFNYPLLLGGTKLGAALAAGCTMVLLASPLAPLAILALAGLARQAGIPDGVLNIIAGGVEAGRALTTHPQVDKISFTGSVNVGRQVMMQAAEGLCDVVLELGGKSAAILLPGTDYEKFAFQLHVRYARNAGQGCGSPTRILIEESRYAEFCESCRKIYPRILVGDPRADDTILGPVITASQRDRIEAAVAQAVADGAEIIAGGGRPAIDRGWYINPTLVGRLDNNSPIARNELFGPVSVVLTYRDVEEAIQIANDSELGLKAYIFGPTAKCLEIAPRLRVGTVQINGGSPLRPDAPMTGCKLSGVGSEWGEDGLREFVHPQHIDVPVT